MVFVKQKTFANRRRLKVLLKIIFRCIRPFSIFKNEFLKPFCLWTEDLLEVFYGHQRPFLLRVSLGTIKVPLNTRKMYLKIEDYLMSLLRRSTFQWISIARGVEPLWTENCLIALLLKLICSRPLVNRKNYLGLLHIEDFVKAVHRQAKFLGIIFLAALVQTANARFVF